MIAPALRTLRQTLARITTKCLFVSQGSGSAAEGTQQARQLNAGHGSCQPVAVDSDSKKGRGRRTKNTSAQPTAISPIAPPAAQPAGTALPEPTPLSAPPSPPSAEALELALEIGELLGEGECPLPHMEPLPPRPNTPDRMPEDAETRAPPRLRRPTRGPKAQSKRRRGRTRRATFTQASAEEDAQQAEDQAGGEQEKPNAGNTTTDRLEQVPTTGLEPVISLPARIEASIEDGTLELTLSTVINNLLRYTRAARSVGALCAWQQQTHQIFASAIHNAAKFAIAATLAYCGHDFADELERSTVQIVAMLAKLEQALQQAQTEPLTLMAYSGAYATRLSIKCGRARANLTSGVACLVAKIEEPFHETRNEVHQAANSSHRAEIAEILDEMPVMVTPYLRSLGAANKSAHSIWERIQREVSKLRRTVENDAPTADRLRRITASIGAHLKRMEAILDGAALQDAMIWGELQRRLVERRKAPTLEKGRDTLKTAPEEQEYFSGDRRSPESDQQPAACPGRTDQPLHLRALPFLIADQSPHGIILCPRAYGVSSFCKGHGRQHGPGAILDASTLVASPMAENSPGGTNSRSRRALRNRAISRLASTRIVITSESCPAQIQHWAANPLFPVVAASRGEREWTKWRRGMSREQARAQLDVGALNRLFTHLLGGWHSNLVAALRDLRLRTAPGHRWHTTATANEESDRPP